LNIDNKICSLPI